MTVIRPNSVSGINSITAQANEIKIFKSDGTQGGLVIGGANLNATSGISTVAALNVTGNVSVGGTLTYQDVTNIDSVGVITARDGLNVTGGRVLIGTTTEGESGADDLTIATSSTTGITIRSGTSNAGNIYFSDGTSGAAEYRGQVSYLHNEDSLVFGTDGAERLRITSTGLINASSNTSAVALPQGTTAQRPTGSAPYIRKNTTNNALEYYDGTSWVEIITDYFPTGSVIFS